MNVDHNAPLVTRREIVIDAPLEVVWKLQTDFRAWPDWQGNSLLLEGQRNQDRIDLAGSGAHAAHLLDRDLAGHAGDPYLEL